MNRLLWIVVYLGTTAFGVATPWLFNAEGNELYKNFRDFLFQLTGDRQILVGALAIIPIALVGAAISVIVYLLAKKYGRLGVLVAKLIVAWDLGLATGLAIVLLLGLLNLLPTPDGFFLLFGMSAAANSAGGICGLVTLKLISERGARP